MRLQVQFLALLSGSRIQHCCELWCRSQTWLRSHIAAAVVQASSCSSNWTTKLGTSICRECSPRKRPKKKEYLCQLGYHPTLVRMTIIKSTNNKSWRGCGEKGTLLNCWWQCKLVQPLWRTAWRYLRNIYIELSCDPAIPLLGIYPDKTLLKKDTLEFPS